MSLTTKYPLSWKEVFEFWEDNEGESSHWARHARDRGYASWEEWRMEYANALGLPEKTDWVLHKINDPLITIPQFHGGPFSGWINRYYNGNTDPTLTFAELAELGKIQTHDGIASIMNAFPDSTVLTGLIMPDNSIVIIEGMHRCCAIALLAKTRQLLAANVYIALAHAGEDVLSIVGGYEKK